MNSSDKELKINNMSLQYELTCNYYFLHHNSKKIMQKWSLKRFLIII